MSLLAAVYLAGVLVGLAATDAPWPSRIGLSLLWPLGPAAFAVTVAILLAASLVAFPLVGAIVLAGALAAAFAAAAFAAPAPALDARSSPHVIELRTPHRPTPKAFVVVSLLLLGVGPWTVGASAAGGGLQQLLSAELARFPAKAGIYVRHLATGEEAAVRGDETFNSASVIKIPVMALAYELAGQGRLNLDARVELRKADFRGGSGVLRYHDAGLQPTVRDLVTQMIITSDNTATDMVLAQVGGVAAVNAWLTAHGHEDLRLNRTLFDVFKRRYVLVEPSLASLTAEELYALQSGDPSFANMPRERFDAIQQAMRRPGVPEELTRQVNEEPSTWLGRITPRGIGRLVESIETCGAGGGDLNVGPYCDEMKRALRRQQAGARRLPHFLDVPVGHKTGDFPPVLANDVGVVYARSGPIVVAFLTNAIREPYAELEDRMGRTARAIVDYFDGAAGAQAPSPRVVDLGHPLREGDPSWTGSPAFDRDGTRENGRFESQEHFGTHLDAPSHFGGQWTADAIPVDRLVRPGVCVNVTGRPEDYRLTAADLKAFEARHGAIPEGAVVLVATGWDARWPDRKAYMNERDGTKHFPGIGVDAARYLVERKVAGIAIDTPSVDYGPSEKYETHNITNPANIYHVENARGLTKLPPTGFTVVVAPVNLAGGSGGPTRLFALLP